MVTIIKLKSLNNAIKIIYKPGDSSSIRAFNKFINWLNERTKFSFKCPKTIHKKHYCWQEYIDYKDCQSISDVKNFYFTLGGLLCISYLLGSKDIHSENIIAHGKDPYLIDLECLLSPIVLDNKNNYIRLRNLVSSTLILPVRNMGDIAYSGYDNSVIGDAGNQELPFKKKVWLDYATTKMRAARVEVKSKERKNFPKLKGSLHDPSLYVKNFIDGFSTLYRFFIKNKKLLMDESRSPLIFFKNIWVRVILRPTNHYSQLLQESYHPLLLNRVDERKKHFDFLKKTIKNSPEYKHIIKSELYDLSKQNIPIFLSNTSENYIYNSKLKKTLLETMLSPIDNAYNIIKNISMSDFDIQKTIIINSINALKFDYKHNQYSMITCKKRKHSEVDIEDVILHIADKIYKLKIKDGHGVSWPSVDPFGTKLSGAITDISLYSGSLGILFLLFMTGIFFNIPKYIKMSTFYVRNMVTDIMSLKQSYNNLGMYCGLGGLIYITALMTKFVDFIALCEIEKCVSTFSNIIRDNEESFDMMYGYSGFMNAIINSKHKLSDQSFNYYINLCKDKLISCDISQYPNLNVASYAHGFTGVYWTLSKTLDSSSDRKTKHIILDLLRTERDSFDVVNGGWKDTRNNAELHFQHGWCHGSIGVGLAKLGMLRLGLQSDYTEQELLVVANSLEDSGFNSDWSLCHGNLAKMDFLHEFNKIYATEKTKTLFDDFLNSLMFVIKNESLAFFGDKDLFVPGLFNGLGGVLYMLLKYKFPNDINSLLVT